MSSTPMVVLITVPSQESGEAIARRLVEQRLAACVNLVGPIRSLFTWEGKLNDEQEFMLVAKTTSDLFEDGLVPAVKSLHPYQVPEIIALPILMGSTEYLDWIQASTLP